MQVRLSKLPDPKKTYTVDFPTLSGGLNLRELEYRLPTNQSPEMKNLWWQDGILQCRDGQVYLSDSTALGDGYTCSAELFWGNAFFHIGTKLYYADMSAVSFSLIELEDSVPGMRGTFFRYNDCLYYKTVGAFYRIKYHTTAPVFTCEDVTEDAYIPIIVMNASPDNGSGDLYQPENRLSAAKTVSYNAKTKDIAIKATGDGVTRNFSLGYTGTTELVSVLSVYVDGDLISTSEYTVRFSDGTVRFSNGAPGRNDPIVINTRVVTRDYQLPIDITNDLVVHTAQQTGDGTTREYTLVDTTSAVLRYVTSVTLNDVATHAYSVDFTTGKVTFTTAPASGVAIKIEYKSTDGDIIDSVDSVTVSGVTQQEQTDYTVNKLLGTVTFVAGHAPPVTTPATNNTVKITFSKSNSDAYQAITDCKYAIVSGDGKSLCVVMAGSTKQPNAVFWNSNDSIGMNDSYWPMSYYNLVGDTEDPVSGFGMQYNDTIVFQRHSVGKLGYGIESIDDRDAISFTYERVNSSIGCDLPWTIQLIENNLVFCNSYKGAQVLRSSSAAYENNVESISKNVDGNESGKGLKYDIRVGDDEASSFDDGNRYWICANGHVYAWDYEISTYENPSWFYFDNIHGIAFFHDDGDGKYHLDAAGRVTKFNRSFSDYNSAIDKVYQFPIQHFDTYSAYKDIDSVIITTRGDTNPAMQIQYQCDYGVWTDPTPILVYSWRLSPRNLAYRFLGVLRYATVAKRRPGLRHIRHFGMRLTNNTNLNDMAIVSAQIYYKYSGKER